MNEIIPHLFLGDIVDGHKHQHIMPVLCVMWEGENNIPPKATQIATTGFIMKIPNGGADAFAIEEKMDEAADWIHQHLMKEESVLVQCLFGIERSPLTVVWYLMRYQGMNLKEAYTLVMKQRPQVQYRGGWLEREIRLTGYLPVKV